MTLFSPHHSSASFRRLHIIQKLCCVEDTFLSAVVLIFPNFKNFKLRKLFPSSVWMLILSASPVVLADGNFPGGYLAKPHVKLRNSEHILRFQTSQSWLRFCHLISNSSSFLFISADFFKRWLFLDGQENKQISSENGWILRCKPYQIFVTHFDFRNCKVYTR